MNVPLRNPYIGPRTFQRSDRDLFFGRDREARDLMALLSSERLILFYAQSGAGKSSLLNTCLIPELEENNYEVLPIGRLQGNLSAHREVENIYVYNLMSSIVQQRIDPQEFASTSLSQFMTVLHLHESSYLMDEGAASPLVDVPHLQRVLVIDQFEELFTTNLDAWKKREDFFRQLAQAMKDDPSLTVMLVMREDYIASLDLYSHILPGGLRTRYYMQRLTRGMALKAVRNPVEQLRPFAEGVAEKLVDDLASILIHRPDDVQELHSGQYVEPVQLQVVCYSLWESLAPGGCEITKNDLVEVGNVDESLERFYDQRVAAVAKEMDVPERVIREWFGEKLITSSKTRNLVLQRIHGDGLRDDVIQCLRGDLVREELRTGQIWYELSHDRLIDPILTSNTKWFEQHLSLFQRQVVLWAQQGKSENLLLRGTELGIAEREADTWTLTADEQEFLDDCRNLRRRERRDQIQRRIIGVALIIALILLTTTVVFYRASAESLLKAQTSLSIAESAKATAQASENEALTQKKIAEEQKKIAIEQKSFAEEQASKAMAGSLAAEADSIKNSNHARSLLLAIESYRHENNLLTRTTLFELLQFTPYTRLFGFKGSVTDIAISPSGEWMAIASSEQISIVEPETNQIVSTVENPGMVNSLAFNNDGSLLAAGGCSENECSDAAGMITLWDVGNPLAPRMLSKLDRGHTAQIKSVAFSNDGKHLASGSYDRTINLWDVSSPTNPRPYQTLSGPGHHERVLSLTFSPDGRALLSGEADGTLHVWNIKDPSFPEVNVYPAHPYAIYSITFNPSDTGMFASASDDETVILWKWVPDSFSVRNPLVLTGHTGKVHDASFNATGTILASSSFDDTVILWDTQTGERIGPALSAHENVINAIAFGKNDTQDLLFTGSDDRTVILWDLSTHQPLSRPLAAEPDHASPGREVTNENFYAVVNGQQIEMKVDGQGPIVLTGHTGAVNTLDITPQVADRRLLASASDDQTVILWDVTLPTNVSVFLKLESFKNPLLSAYFGNDGKRLFTVDSDEQVTEWIIDPAEWLRLACQTVRSTSFISEDEYNQACASIP